MTSGSHTVTSVSNPWSPSIVGANFVLVGAGVHGGVLSTTVTAYNSAGSLTLAAAADTTAGGGMAIYGHDDRAAFVAAFATSKEVWYDQNCYWSSGISLSTQTIFRGNRRNIIYQGGGSDRITVNTGADGSVFDGLYLDGTRANSGFGFAIGIVDKVQVKNCTIKLAGVGIRCSGASANASKYAEILNNEMIGCGNAITVQGFKYSKFNGNKTSGDADGSVARGYVISHLEEGEVCENTVEGNFSNTIVGILFKYERTLGPYANKNIRCFRNQIYNINQEGISVDQGNGSLVIFATDSTGETVPDTATGGSVTTLTKATASWVTNAYAGNWLRLVGGTGSNQYVRILSNTATTLTFRKALAVAPAAGTLFYVNTANCFREGGTATSGSLTALRQTGAAWDAGEFVGYSVALVAGTGRGQIRTITSNSTDTLAPDYAFNIAPDATTKFSIIALQSGIEICENNVNTVGTEAILNYGASFNNKIIGNYVYNAVVKTSSDNDYQAGIASFSIEGATLGTLEKAPVFGTIIANNHVFVTNSKNGIMVGCFNPSGQSGMYNGYIGSYNALGYTINGNDVKGRIDKGYSFRGLERSTITDNKLDGSSGDTFLEDTVSMDNYFSGNKVNNSVIKPVFKGLRSFVNQSDSLSPNGNYTAQRGAVFYRTNGGRDSTIFIKAAGDGGPYGWFSLLSLDSNYTTNGVLFGNKYSAFETTGYPKIYGGSGGSFAAGDLIISARSSADRDIIFQSRVGATAVQAGRVQGGSGVLDWAYDVKLSTAGKGLYVKEGSNATMGTATLVAGTVVVNTTKVTANSRIFLTIESLGTVVLPKAVAVTARTNGTSFTITSSDATDTSVIGWIIIEPS